MEHLHFSTVLSGDTSMDNIDEEYGQFCISVTVLNESRAWKPPRSVCLWELFSWNTSVEQYKRQATTYWRPISYAEKQ